MASGGSKSSIAPTQVSEACSISAGEHPRHTWKRTMGFRLFHEFDAVADLAHSAASADLYALLAKFRDAVKSGDYEWAEYPEAQQYAEVCFWAIRKLEYSFAAEA